MGKAAGVDGQRENSLGQAEGIFNKHVGKPVSGHCTGRLRVPTVNFETLKERELQAMPMRASSFVCQVLCFALVASADGPESPIQLLQEARDIAATARVEERQKSERADVLIDVARAFAALGDLERANKTAEILRVNDFWHKSAIAAVAVARARRGDFVGAFATLARSDAGPAVLARRELAKLQAQRGQIRDAIKTCDTVGAINPRRASQFLVEAATIAQRWYRDRPRPSMERGAESH